MTNELKPLVFSISDLAYVDEVMVEKNFDNPHDHAVYKATEVDKVLAQKDFEIDRIKEFNAFLKQRISNGDVDCSTLLDDLEQKDKEIAKLKQKLQDQCIHCPVKMQEDDVVAELKSTERRLQRALWLARAERYKIKEFVAREEGNLSNQMSWSRILRERTYNQWVDQLLRIANLANKLQNKCLAKAEGYK